MLIFGSFESNLAYFFFHKFIFVKREPLLTILGSLVRKKHQNVPHILTLARSFGKPRFWATRVAGQHAQGASGLACSSGSMSILAKIDI